MNKQAPCQTYEEQFLEFDGLCAEGVEYVAHTIIVMSKYGIISLLKLLKHAAAYVVYLSR